MKGIKAWCLRSLWILHIMSVYLLVPTYIQISLQKEQRPTALTTEGSTLWPRSSFPFASSIWVDSALYTRISRETSNMRIILTFILTILGCVLSAREMLRQWTLPNEGTGEFCNTLLPLSIFGPGNQSIHFGDEGSFFCLLGLLGYQWVDLFLNFWFSPCIICFDPHHFIHEFFFLVVSPWHRCGSTWSFSEFWITRPYTGPSTALVSMHLQGCCWARSVVPCSEEIWSEDSCGERKMLKAENRWRHRASLLSIFSVLPLRSFTPLSLP